jgi:hypothetical protein
VIRGHLHRLTETVLDFVLREGAAASGIATRETLLSERAPGSATVVIPGRGNSLIVGQRKTELGCDEVASAVLFNGGVDAGIPTDRVEDWLRRLLDVERQARREQLALALMLISRRTDNRNRDIDEELRSRVLARLEELKASSAWITMVEEVVEDEDLDQSVLGESLPPGLRLFG